MRWDVVVVGSTNVDLVLTVARHPRPGETLIGGSGELFAGGKGANQAVAAARLGARTAMVGAVGGDPNAAVALSELTAADVDLEAMARVPGPTGLAVVTLADDGENTIVVVPGANAAVTPAVVEAARAVVGGARICLLQAEIPLEAVTRAAAIAAAEDVRVVLNLAPACQLPIATLRLADPLVVNEHEVALLLGWLRAEDGPSPAPAVTGGTPATHAEALAAARALRAYGVRSVVVTLGRLGAVGIGADGEWSLPARTVPVRDTTGAGDAFVGALAAALAAGHPLADAAATATGVAAFSVQRLGAQASYPWKDDPLP
ncbi:ribokinase [Pengzhenrongella frigida]|uniref:ribokinase n=1 Tax=Pengzhenrongella frigida TaxID=1259133 RepID=UPI001F5DE142|nr:ribokinase [Cellulomonas sp. HLT2-17]